MPVRFATPGEIQQRLEAREDLLILDVREPWEIALCQIPSSVAIPMGQIPSRLRELPKDRELVVVCHHGMRSLQVARFLERNGFERLCNLEGGIDRWARELDPAMPVY